MLDGINQIVKIGLEDVCNAFGIKEDLFEKYVIGEIMQNADLRALHYKRDDTRFDWKQITPLGGTGTTLNACVLYSLIRYFTMGYVIETGVSGGYYTSFMLEALNKNKIGGLLTSLEISNDKNEVGKLVPKSLELTCTLPDKAGMNAEWDLNMGRSSLDVFKEWKAKGYKHSAELYSHDSLHSLSHMVSELYEFKQSLSNRFIIFIDDQNSDSFWERCLQTKMFNKQGFSVKYISGKESRLQGHLGGFVQYVRL